MATTLNTIRFRRTTYFVERVKDPHAHLIPVHFVLHDPRGRCYLLVPTTRRPDRLVAIACITRFSPYRPTPFAGMWFAVEDGKLVIAAPDAQDGDFLASTGCDATNLFEFVTRTSDSPELEPGYEEERQRLPDPRGYQSQASAWAGVVGTEEPGSIDRVPTEQSANWTEGSFS